MKISNIDIIAECKARYIALRKLGFRAVFLFVNFFLIIMALYQLKPASRSLFIESIGAQQLPYIWIATALTMGVFIAFYHRLVERHSRINVVLSTCLVVSALLLGFRILLNYPGPFAAAGLYVFVDILGVVLIEQFWSLTNSIYTTQEGKSWYGFVGTGGLVGGVVGGWVSAIFIKYTPLQTPDLLLTAAAIIAIIFLLTWIMGQAGIFCEVDHVVRIIEPGRGRA